MSEGARAQNPEPHEIDSIYVSPQNRFVVSLIVGYGGEEEGTDGVTTPERAAAAALELSRDMSASDTVWHVFDRTTGRMHMLVQRVFEREEPV